MKNTTYWSGVAILFTCLLLIVGCGITGTAKKDAPQVTKAEFVEMKQLVIDQNKKLDEVAVYMKQIATNTGRIADVLEKEELSTKELLDSMSRF